MAGNLGRLAILCLVAHGLWLGGWARLLAQSNGPPPIADGTPIVDVRVVGARRFPEAAVLNELKTRRGKNFSKQAVIEDTRRLDLSQRYATGVLVETTPHPDGVVVDFRVVERATIREIKYQGFAHLSTEDLEAATALKKGMPMSVALNRRAVQNLERLYHSKGRLFAQVRLLEGDKDDDLNVVFQATEGPVVRIRDISMIGNQFVSGARLKTQIESSSRILGLSGEYNPMMLDHDVAKLVEYYRGFGFFDVRVRREVRWNEGHETVDVAFVIEEGQRFTVRDVQVVGNQRLESDVLLARNHLKAGEPFKQNVLQASVKLMNDEYGRRGEINSRVTPLFDFDENNPEVTVRYQVTEGQPATVGTINIIGNTVTQDRVIRRQLGVYPGQILNVPAMRQSEANLRRLGIFKVEPEQGIAPTITVLDPDGPSPVKDLLVEIQEDRTGSINFGAGINSDAGASLQVVLNERNFDITRFPTSWDDMLSGNAFRGAGQEFRMEAVPGTLFNRYSVSWREPYLFDTPYSLSTQAYYMTRQFNEYTEQRLGGRFSVGHRFTPLWSGSVGMRIEQVDCYNIVPFAPPQYLDIQGQNFIYGPKLTLNRDTRDSFLRPTEGNNLEIGMEYMFGDWNYPIATAEDAQFFTLYERPDGSGRHVLALRGMVGFAGADTPAFDAFFAGGNHTIRGFDFRGVGPTVNGFKVGGDFMMIGSVEYQLPLMANDKVFAVVFSDFGTVESDVRIDHFRCSVGAGLRLVVPMFGPLPIALDWAIPVAKAPFDNERIFSFYVGFTR